MPRGSSVYHGGKATGDERIVAPYLQEVQAVLNRSMGPGSFSLASALPRLPSRNGLSQTSSRVQRSNGHLGPLSNGIHQKLSHYRSTFDTETSMARMAFDVEIQVKPKMEENTTQCEPEIEVKPLSKSISARDTAEYEEVLEENFRLKRLIDDLQFRLDETLNRTDKTAHAQYDSEGLNVNDAAIQCDLDKVDQSSAVPVVPLSPSGPIEQTDTGLTEQLSSLLAGHACRQTLLEDVKSHQLQQTQTLFKSMLLGHIRRRQLLQAVDAANISRDTSDCRM